MTALNLIRRSTRLFPAMLGGVIILAAAGCSSGNGATQTVPTNTSAFHKAAEMPAEVTNAIRDFNQPLPTGIKWFKGTPSQLRQSNTRYEDGVAGGVVAFYWLCSWEKSYLDAFDGSNAAKESSSIAMLRKWESLPFYKAHFIDPEHGWRHTILDPAALGDPTALRTSFKNECSNYIENNPS